MEELVNKAKNGDGAAFVELIRLCKQSMYKMAWIYLQDEHDIADAMQDTILSCYEKLETLREPAYFRTWMMRILINKCTDILRQRSRTGEIMERKDGEDCGELEHCEWKELLLCLKEKDRKIVELYYYDEFSIKEIGALLKINENTVATRLRRARQKNAALPSSCCGSSCGGDGSGSGRLRPSSKES